MFAISWRAASFWGLILALSTGSASAQTPRVVTLDNALELSGVYSWPPFGLEPLASSYSRRPSRRAPLTPLVSTPAPRVSSAPSARRWAITSREATPSLDPESRSATAVLSLSRGAPGLQPGAFLQARIRPSGEIDRDRIAVPEDAIQVVEGRDIVFVRTKTGFQARDVELGTRSAGQVTILSGLQEGWRIAVANAFLLKAELGKEGATHGH